MAMLFISTAIVTKDCRSNKNNDDGTIRGLKVQANWTDAILTLLFLDFVKANTNEL